MRDRSRLTDDELRAVVQALVVAAALLYYVLT
jgi:hypothetical protein